MAKVLAFAGSARSGSVNKRLAAAAAERTRARGVEVTLIDLRDFEMPLYDEDWEQEHGAPEATGRLYDLMLEHQGLLLACPEYNSSITPLLKNTIDWLSRGREGDPPLSAFRGKTAGLLAASPGALGGLRGLVTVRSILGNIGVHVIPTQVAVPKAHEVLGEDSAINDEGVAKRVEQFAEELAETTKKMAASR